MNGSRAEVELLLKEGKRQEVFKRDQLWEQMRADAVSRGFHEPSPAFDPTFKFDKWTDTYDTSAKQRVPAWTDRVLYRSPPGLERAIVPTAYTSCPAVRASDHKPVAASFDVLVNAEQDRSRALARGGASRGSMACAVM